MSLPICLPSLEFLSSTLPLLGEDVAQRQERVLLRNSFLSKGEIEKGGCAYALPILQFYKIDRALARHIH